MKDPVCGMEVDPAKAAGTSEYNGKTYYFCAKSLQDEVRRQPAAVREVGPCRPATSTPARDPDRPKPRSSTRSAA